MAALSFSGPLHQTGTGIPAGTDEMFDVLHLLSHGASWRTFEFLGFTHACVNKSTGWFVLRRVTSKQRMRAKLSEVKTALRRRQHLPIPEQGRWLASVIRGHCNYYGVPGNSDAINAFREQATRHRYWALRRRSQRHA